MKDKIKEILVDIYQIDGRLEDEATERILRLFSVSCQLELFIAMIEKMTESDWREADNGFADRVFDRLNGNK